MNIKQLFTNVKTNLKKKFAKTLGIKTIYEYKAELESFMDQIELLGDTDVIDSLVASDGIAGTARQYQEINSYFKSYYRELIREIQQAENTSPELKQMARTLGEEWESTLRNVIHYLYKKKQMAMYGESLGPDYFSNSSVKVFHANSFANQELPWLRKEALNEDHFDEGLVGASVGAAFGAILTLTVSSLSKTFGVSPKAMVGISSALGAVIGHFVQKHYFIDFTNYVKLKRYVTYEPEAYELILEMMQRNAEKFKTRNPQKYKQILINLDRLQKNPPPQYRSYLDDEIEKEYQQDEDPNQWDVKDDDGEVVKRSSSDILTNNNYYSSSSYKSTRRNKSRDSGREYTLNDLATSAENLNGMINQLIAH